MNCNECGGELQEIFVMTPEFKTPTLTHHFNLEYWFCSNRECGYFELPWLRSELYVIALKKENELMLGAWRRMIAWLKKNGTKVPRKIFENGSETTAITRTNVESSKEE